MEIELKLLIQSSAVDAFYSLLDKTLIPVARKEKLQLSNGYYDTQDAKLRFLDIGLRTRSTKYENGTGWNEQTIKLAGKDIGGLHQRPEHTVKLNDNPNEPCFPKLALFPEDIWPEVLELNSLQANIEPLFITDFTREVWIVSMPGGTEIELVLDQGRIHTASRESEISEIELELIDGDVSDLFSFAKFLVSHLPLRLGNLSKAARGYMLVNGATLESYNLDSIAVNSTDNIETSMVKMLSHSLKYLQHHEQVFYNQRSLKSLRRIIDGLSQLIHIIQLFSREIPSPSLESLIKRFKMCRKQLSWVDIFYQLKQLTNRHSPYRKAIEDSDVLSALLTEQLDHDQKLEEAAKLFSSELYNLTMLQFINWLNRKEWRSELDIAEISRLDNSIATVAGDWLDRAWQKLLPQLVEMQDVSESSYIEKLYWPLATELLTGLCVGHIYHSEAWANFRDPLVDLLIGCEELMLLNTLEELIDQKIEAQPSLEKHKTWLTSKQQSLLIALTATINNCSKLNPYW